MSTQYDGGVIKFDDRGYSNIFNLESTIKTKVDISQLKEMISSKDKWRLREVDDIVSRDVARVLIPEILNEQIQTKIEEQRIGRNLVDVMQVDGPTFSWLVEDKFEAEHVPEGAEIPTAHLTWEKRHATLFKSAIRCVITREMIEDSQWDIVRRHIDQGSIAMARIEDADIIHALNVGVPDDTDIDANGHGGHGENIGNHRIGMGPADSGNPLTWNAIAKGYIVLRQENYRPDTMLVNPVQMHDLMVMDEFIGAGEAAYMSVPNRLENVMETGAIGSIAGMNVIVSNNQPKGQVIMFDSSVYGVLAEGRPASIDRYDDYVRQMEGLVISSRYVPVAVRRSAAVMLNDGKTSLTT